MKKTIRMVIIKNKLMLTTSLTEFTAVAFETSAESVQAYICISNL